MTNTVEDIDIDALFARMDADKRDASHRVLPLDCDDTSDDEDLTGTDCVFR